METENNMRNLMELIELGVPLEIGAYIGYEFMRMLVDCTARLILRVIKYISRISRNDEE